MSNIKYIVWQYDKSEGIITSDKIATECMQRGHWDREEIHSYKDHYKEFISEYGDGDDIEIEKIDWDNLFRMDLGNDEGIATVRTRNDGKFEVFVEHERFTDGGYIASAALDTFQLAVEFVFKILTRL